MKNRNKAMFKNLIVSFIILLCISVITTISLGNKVITQAETYKEQSETQTYNIENTKFLLDNYALNYIGTLASIDKVNGNYQVVNSNKDDPITQIIPKNYFYTLGDELILENNYGYYINTESYGDGNFSSIAMVFEIETISDLYTTIDRVIVTVKPLFQYEYLCLKGQASFKIGQNDVSYSLDSYCVIPIPTLSPVIEYKQKNKYYLKDISFAATLYNEQHLNVGEDGYSAQDDYGSYFTALDYEYDGKTRVYGEFPYGQAATTIMDVTSIGLSAVGIIPGVGSITSAIGLAFDIATAIGDGIVLLEDFMSWSNGDIVYVDKKITTSCFYQNRKDQLEHYNDKNGNPALIKFGAVTCNTGTDQSLWYGVGNYARAYFYVGHGDGDGVSPCYTRFIDNIALKVVDSSSDKVVKVGGGLSSCSLRNPEYKSLSIDKTETVYMLPSGQDHFTFRPKYESDYEVSIKLSSEADVYINGKAYHGKEISASTYIASGSGININFSNNNVGLTGTISISPNTTNEATKISSNGSYLMKLDLSGVKELKTNNANIVIENFYTLEDGNLNKYLFNGEIEPIDTISYPFKEDTYYVLLHNTTSNYINSWSFDVNEVGKLKIGEENDVTLQASNLNYFSIDSDSSSNYVVSLDNVECHEYNYLFINTELANLNGISYLDGVYIIAMDANKTYYIGVKTGKKESNAKIIIKSANASFQWKITGGNFGENGITTSERVVNVLRGYTYKLTFIINGAEKNSGLISEDTATSWGLYGASINANTGEIAIPASCPIGGNGIIIKAWASATDDTSYNHTIRLVPRFQNLVNSVSIDNSTWIKLNVDVQKYVSKIDYKISGLDANDNLVTHYRTMKFENYPNNGTNTFVNILPDIDSINSTSVVAISVKITQIYYFDALNNECSYSNSSYSFYVNNLFEGGSGSSLSPYLINCVRHLENIRGRATLKFNYKLTSRVYFYDSDVWTPIPDFRGTLDGNGNYISHFRIDESEGGNIGFVKINNGVIKNLKLGTYFCVGEEYSNVSVGAFAGLNKGRIENCTLTAAYNRPFFRCYIRGDSYMGCFVGTNEGTIDGCYGGDWLKGNCNMGTVAGRNSGTIRNCNVHSSIDADYYDYNFSVGGIVGIQTGGQVVDCHFEGKISFIGYNTDKYNSLSTDRTLQVCVGTIIGYKQGGTISGNTWEIGAGNLGDVVGTPYELGVVKWTTGALWWKKTHTHDQGLYFKNEACGRED